MLLRIAIKNFLSFHDEVVFDMFPNPKREFMQNHIYQEEIPLLKQAAIYGANGSGKSNFIKAFWFLKSFIENQDFIKEDINITDFRFQLAQESNLPISLTVEFCQNNAYYIYEVSINDTIIESLSISGLGRKPNALIFKRNGTNVNSTLVTNPESSKQLLQKNPWASLLSLNNQFPILAPCKQVNDLIEWFSNLEVISINSEAPVLINLMSKNKQLLDFANEILRNVGISNSLEIKSTPLEKLLNNIDKKNANEIQRIIDRSRLDEQSGITLGRNHRTEYDLTIQKGKSIVREFIFEQLGVNGYKKGMKMASQSDGTARLLTLIPAFFDALNKDCLIVIDEIENSIHPDLIYKIVQYFADNESHGQIIFTTHLTRFQNQQELMRPDELWKVEKTNGCTAMRSFNDYNIHHTMNIEKGYNTGRYGGVPFISKIAGDGQ